MADPARDTKVYVDQLAPSMTYEEFAEAIAALGEQVVGEGTDFDRLYCYGPDEGRALHCFINEMQLRVGFDNDVVWRFKPNIGTHRDDATIWHVVSARFRLVPREKQP
jgi:hypothetical protein